MEEGEPPRSRVSIKKAKVRFTNGSSQTVGVYWIDYEGREKLCKVLPARHCVDVDTFVSHPWIFREIATEERYAIKNREVYYATPHFMVDGPRSVRLIRVNAIVAAPLRSLERCALLFLARRLRLDAVERLEIPRLLLRELKSLVEIYATPRTAEVVPFSSHASDV